VNPYRHGTFSSKKFIHHSVPSTYIHNIHHFALLLFGMHVTDWGTEDEGGAGQCRYLVGRAGKSTGCCACVCICVGGCL